MLIPIAALLAVVGAGARQSDVDGVSMLHLNDDPPDFADLECQVHKLALRFGVSKVR